MSPTVILLLLVTVTPSFESYSSLLSFPSPFLSTLSLQVIYVWQYETNSVMSKGNWIWGFRAASGGNLQMNLECRKTLRSIHLLVTLPSRLSHHEAQRGRNAEEKSQELDWDVGGKGGQNRRMKTKPKTDGTHSTLRYRQTIHLNIQTCV